MQIGSSGLQFLGYLSAVDRFSCFILFQTRYYLKVTYTRKKNLKIFQLLLQAGIDDVVVQSPKSVAHSKIDIGIVGRSQLFLAQ